MNAVSAPTITPDLAVTATAEPLSWLTVGVGIASAAAVAVCASFGLFPLAVALTVLGLMLSWGWPRALNLPSRAGSQRALLAGVAAISVVEFLADKADGLRWLGTALAIGLIVVFLHELLRRDGRPRLTESIGGSVFGLAVAASGAFFVNSVVEVDGVFATYAACAGVAIGLLVDAFFSRAPRVREWDLPVSMVLAALAGFLMASLQDRAWNVGLISSLAACAVAHGLRSVLGRITRPNARTASAVASVLIVGVIPYASAWLLSR